MASFIRDRITLVWLGLVLATCFSWEAGGDHGFIGDIRSLGGVVLFIAFLKARYIMLEFMELRHAPLVMRLFAECWAALVCAAVIIFYWGDGMSRLVSGSVEVSAAQSTPRLVAGEGDNWRKSWQ